MLKVGAYDKIESFSFKVKYKSSSMTNYNDGLGTNKDIFPIKSNITLYFEQTGKEMVYEISAHHKRACLGISDAARLFPT